MLGYIYRSVNQSLVDTEKLLKLLNEPTEVNDKPDASDLIVEDGEIEFGEFEQLSKMMYSTSSIHPVSQIMLLFPMMGVPQH